MNTIKKWAKDLKRYLTKDDIYTTDGKEAFKKRLNIMHQ